MKVRASATFCRHNRKCFVDGHTGPNSLFCSVQFSYGSGINIVFKSVCPWYDRPETSTRRQWAKRMMSLSRYIQDVLFIGRGAKRHGGMTSTHGRTPMYGSQTPMYGTGSRTPMYGSQTPLHDGERFISQMYIWSLCITAFRIAVSWDQCSFFFFFF